MDTFAKLPATGRKDYLQETASRRNTSATVIEKDFWVCWVLKQLFDLKDIPALSFKGGTSLSKVYQLIQRFSEDIDVSLDRAALGFSGERDLANAPSKNKRKQLATELRAAIEKMVNERILPELTAAVTAILGSNGWKLAPSTESNDEMTLDFQYPTSFEYTEYLLPSVKIEFGRGDQQPHERCSIRPYVAEEFPGDFATPSVDLNVLACERTFWEKVTLLHAQYNRPEPSSIKARMSRHWHDVAVMSTDVRFEDDKLDKDLLHQVIEFKEIYFPSSWASYETAVPGTLRIVPHEELEKILREDYKHMQEMIWGDPISFDEVLSRLRRLEERINARKTQASSPS